MDFSSDYHKTLQDWIDSVAPRDVRGSLTKLHSKFVKAAGEDAITLSTLSLWRNGKFKDKLDKRSLTQLAAVRGESIFETRSWLEGTLPSQPLPRVDRPISHSAISISDRARITPLSDLPALIQDLSLAITIASQRLQEPIMSYQFGQLLRHWRMAPKPHWTPYKSLPLEQLIQERTEPWSATRLAEIINREYGLSSQKYTAKHIDALESGLSKDKSLIRFIASLKLILDKDGQPMSDAALIDIAEGRVIDDFQCLDSNG